MQEIEKMTRIVPAQGYLLLTPLVDDDGPDKWISEPILAWVLVWDPRNQRQVGSAIPMTASGTLDEPRWFYEHDGAVYTDDECAQWPSRETALAELRRRFDLSKARDRSGCTTPPASV